MNGSVADYDTTSEHSMCCLTTSNAQAFSLQILVILSDSYPNDILRLLCSVMAKRLIEIQLEL